ncbi:MAG: hypothetical protein MUC48_09530 [Leptolyngbya sp. Prado105]|nr:hypothetical protein [Leptolyngbya sp. Prado105]
MQDTTRSSVTATIHPNHVGQSQDGADGQSHAIDNLSFLFSDVKGSHCWV